MRWLVATFRIQYILAAAAVLGVVSAFTLQYGIGIPTIDTGIALGIMPFTAILPLVLTTTVGALAALGSPALAAASARRHDLYLIATITACATLFAIAHLAALAATGGFGDLGAARNVLAYSGLVLAGQAAFGVRRGPAVPVVYVGLSTVFGRIHGQMQPWAWPVIPATTSDIVLAALALAAGGILASASARRWPAHFYALSNRD